MQTCISKRDVCIGLNYASAYRTINSQLKTSGLVFGSRQVFTSVSASLGRITPYSWKCNP